MGCKWLKKGRMAEINHTTRRNFWLAFAFLSLEIGGRKKANNAAADPGLLEPATS
jgi:hypothetical protein